MIVPVIIFVLIILLIIVANKQEKNENAANAGVKRTVIIPSETPFATTKCDQLKGGPVEVPTGNVETKKTGCDTMFAADEASLTEQCVSEFGAGFRYSRFESCDTGAQVWDFMKKVSSLDIIDMATGANPPKKLVCIKGESLRGVFPYARPTQKGCYLYSPIECMDKEDGRYKGGGCTCPKDYPYCIKGWCLSSKTDSSSWQFGSECGAQVAIGKCGQDYINTWSFPPIPVIESGKWLKKPGPKTNSSCTTLRDQTEQKCSWAKQGVHGYFMSWFNDGKRDIAEKCFT